METVGTKRCVACLEDKALDLFHRHPKTADGRQPYCKFCSNERLKAWKKANPQRNAAQVRRWRQQRKARAA